MLEQILNTLLSVPGIIFAFTLKGYSQAFVAKKLGDPTPEAQGRLTMNPMAHIDLIGFIFLFTSNKGFRYGR
jgi:Zn-dependent protease